MIGGIGSSLATAIRTAGEARSRMDTAARQLATGQRVASVKDDGAAWARANAARGEAAASRVIASDLRVISATVAASRVSLEERISLQGQLRAVALAATDPGLTAATRAALEADVDGIGESMAILPNPGTELPLVSVLGTVWNATQGSTAQKDFAYTVGTGGQQVQTNFSTWSGLGQSFDVSTPALAQTLATVAGQRETTFSLRAAELGAVERALDRTAQNADKRADLGTRLADSLTDADLGRSAAVLRQAQARQQLAFDTVRRALDAYGAFAGGLLANAQRTQRALA